jgi:hypothetical protein
MQAQNANIEKKKAGNTTPQKANNIAQYRIWWKVNVRRMMIRMYNGLLLHVNTQFGIELVNFLLLSYSPGQ